MAGELVPFIMTASTLLVDARTHMQRAGFFIPITSGKKTFTIAVPLLRQKRKTIESVCRDLKKEATSPTKHLLAAIALCQP